jgi:rod shape-determining protein MreD
MIILAALAQGAALVNLFPAFVVPDVLLMVVALWTARNGFEKTWPRAILAGITLDLIFFWPLGINIIALSVVSFSVSFLAKRFLVSQRGWKFIFLVILAVASTIIFHLIYYIISSVLALSNHFAPLGVPSIFGLTIAYKTAVNLFVLFLLYWPVKRIEVFLSMFNQSVISSKR